MITINYNQERDVKGNTYFKQYPDGSNIAALWKKFWSVRIEWEDKVKSISFRLFDMISPDELSLILMQLPLLFKSYNTQYLDKIPKTIILTPKEDITFFENTEWLTDTKTTTIVTQAQYEKMRASTWFIT